MVELFSAGNFFKVSLKYAKVNGKRHRFYSIDIKDVALIAPINNKKELIMEKHFRPVLNKTIYEFPAGYIDEGETPLEAAKRELEEETGFKAGRIKKLFKGYVSPGRSKQIVNFFLADKLTKGNPKHEGGEQINALVTLSLDKAVRMVKTGEIKSTEGIACILYLSQNRHLIG